MCADLFGYPVITLPNSEGAALGAALQALAAVQKGESLGALWNRTERGGDADPILPRGSIDRDALLARHDDLRRRIFPSG
jgi:hypothetical protein